MERLRTMPVPFSRRGFTLIEMSVVIVILALMAALVVPSMVAIKRSRDLHDLEAAIRRAPIVARNEARKSRLPVSLRVDGAALVMERLPADGADPEEFQRVSLLDPVRVEEAQQNGESVDLNSWRWVVYPDGTADSGGLEFSEGTSRKSLILSRDGNARLASGPLPDPTQERWPAGDLEQRVQTS